MLTDETGNLIGKYEYDPFGQILSQPEGTDNPSDLHPYVYVRNNPANRIDPTGELSKCAKDVLSFFGKCTLASFLVIDIPMTIAVGGCLTV